MTHDREIVCAASESNDAIVHKAALRATLAAARRALAPQTKAEWDAAIGAHLLSWWQTHPVPTLGVYWPLRGESDLQNAYLALRGRGVQLVLPVVVARDCALEFAEWEPGEAMQKDPMGVAIPTNLRLQACPPALLVPCLGFNPDGYRLGYGGGYYDRTLARTPRPLTVGVAYACLAAPFASAAHDIALDTIVTEAGPLAGPI